MDFGWWLALNSKSSSMYVLTVTELFKFYKEIGKEQIILKELDLNVGYNEIIGIVGPSGVGKTTLLKVLSFVEPFDFGQIIFEGENVTNFPYNVLQDIRLRKIGFIWQSYNNLFSSLSIKENIIYSAIMGNMSYLEATRQCIKVLDLLDFSDKSNHFPRQLSGGEQQIAAILTQTVRKPVLLLADEPTSRVDSENTRKIFSVLDKIRNDLGISIIIATHDQYLAKMVDMCYTLDRGRLKPSSSIN